MRSAPVGVLAAPAAERHALREAAGCRKRQKVERECLPRTLGNAWQG